jgi:Ca2+-binding EF-hand superfamily protein
MGLLGLETTCLISDRIFSVMCKRRSYVTLGSYLEYMDILLYGSPEEKAEQSFKLITNSDSDGITYEDFVEWLVSMWKMYNSLTGCEINTGSEVIEKYFKELDRNQDGIVDLNEYKEAMSENKNLYEWFEFANRGIKNEDDDEDEIEMDLWAYEKSLNIIEKDLKDCIEILRGNRISLGLSQNSAFQRYSNRISQGISDFDHSDLHEPRKNFGDKDLPDEFDMNEDTGIDFVDKCIFEILAKVKELKGDEGNKEMNGGGSHRRSLSQSSVSFT